MSTRVSSEQIIARDGGDGSTRMQKGQNAWLHITCGGAAAYSQSLNAFFRGPSLPQDKLKPIFFDFLEHRSMAACWSCKSPLVYGESTPGLKPIFAAGFFREPEGSLPGLKLRGFHLSEPLARRLLAGLKPGLYICWLAADHFLQMFGVAGALC